MNLGALKLRRALPTRGDQKRTADAIGALQGPFSRWASGKQRPVTRFRLKLLTLFGIDPLDWDVEATEKPAKKTGAE